MFYAGPADAPLAKLAYKKPAPGSMVIEHTEVNNELQGEGVGLQLVAAAVDFARANQLKIVPVCSFAKSVFNKKADRKSVV